MEVHTRLKYDAQPSSCFDNCKTLMHLDFSFHDIINHFKSDTV